MIIIIGCAQSSCVVPGHSVLAEEPLAKYAGEGVLVLDGGRSLLMSEVAEKGFPEAPSGVVVIEHAYFCFSNRRWSNKGQRKLVIRLFNYKHDGLRDVVLLTRKVSWLDKHVRDNADVKFDLS